MRKIFTLDTTLRDGTQGMGVSFTVRDKLKVAKRLDAFGIDFIEAGTPCAAPRDRDVFRQLEYLPMEHANVVAFGPTMRLGETPETSAALASLLETGCRWVALFGKASRFHVHTVLRISPQENLQMIEQSVRYLASQGKEVIFDAEHFFDGWREDADYALAVLRAAREAGARFCCLCDTKGGNFPDQIARGTAAAVEAVGDCVGIHCHNDMGLAVACSMAAVEAGASMVQGCVAGLGERCGNADLITLIANLQLKCGYDVCPPEHMPELYSLARFVCETANFALPYGAPYVGAGAFTHKAGTHIDAVQKDPATFEHIPPETVGNVRSLAISDASGRAAMVSRITQTIPGVHKDGALNAAILRRIKEMEAEGYRFEDADASLELLIRKEAGIYRSAFELVEFKVIVGEPAVSRHNSSVILTITVDGEEEITAADGDGPVNALDKALRRALERFYPQIAGMRLLDYRVRVLDSDNATASQVRVLIESTDGARVWSTVGVSEDIIHASWLALVDSVEYLLL